MLAAIGQLAAVCIGIPSLIYLAVQIREQTKERRHAAVNALTSQWGDLTRSFHDNADFCAIYLRGIQSFNDLDAVSKLRFSSFLNRFFKNFQAMYFSHCDGVLNASLWGEVERTMSDVIAYPGTQQWWETRRHWHTEEFGRVIDAIIARGDKPTAYSTYNLSEAGCQKISDERSSRLAANRCCRCRSRWRLFRRGFGARGRTNCFHRAKTFRGRRELERSCSGQIGRPTANRRHGDNRYQRGPRLLADSVLRKSTRYFGYRGTNGSIR